MEVQFRETDEERSESEEAGQIREGRSREKQMRKNSSQRREGGRGGRSERNKRQKIDLRWKSGSETRN